MFDIIIFILDERFRPELQDELNELQQYDRCSDPSKMPSLQNALRQKAQNVYCKYERRIIKDFEISDDEVNDLAGTLRLFLAGFYTDRFPSNDENNKRLASSPRMVNYLLSTLEELSIEFGENC